TTSMSLPSPERIFETFMAYQRSAALKAAIELDVFTGIGKGNQTVETLAEYSQAAPRGIRILCDYLVTIGFLSKDDGNYALAPDSSAFLDRTSRAYLGSATGMLCSPLLTNAFTDLTRTVREGTTTLAGEGTVSPENPIWEDFARCMMPMMFPAAQFLAQFVPGKEPIRVLDIAAGHGLFGITIAQRNTAAQVSAVDWRNVLAVAQENAQAMGVAGRYTTIPGDAFVVDWGSEYDVALLTNFLHHFDPPTCGALLRKVYESLKPGGMALTVEFVPNEDRVTPPAAAGFALTMLGTTRAGDAYTLAEYRQMFQKAGFNSPELHPVPGTPSSVLISTRPFA
ncbi:MAG: methyltransferase, partial [Bryobacteraceae bacterium]